MRLGALWVTFITIFTHCNCAELEVLINSVNIGRTTSCVGENVTYVCTVASPVHLWSSASFVDGDETITIGATEDSNNGDFTVRRVAETGGVLTSSVSITSFSGLDNVVIECRDGLGIIMEEQTATAMVLDDCAELEVLINGVNIGRTTSCVGENVTYVCTVASTTHIWRSDSFVQSITIAGISTDVTDANGFTFQSMGLNDDIILTSSVSVTSFPGLNGSLIKCGDGTGLGAQEQNTTAMVIGAPVFTVQQNDIDLTSFDFNIISPYLVPMPSCISSYTYTATPTDGAGTVQDVIMFTDYSSFIVSGFDVCKYTYSFTAVPNIRIDGVSSVGEMSTTVVQDTTDYTITDPITELGRTSDGLVWAAPANAMECSFQYMITQDLSSFTVDTNSVSFAALSNSGFTTCVRQDITVTLVVPINGDTVDGSSSTENLIVLNTNISYTISVAVNQLDITFTWNTMIQGTSFVIIRRDSEFAMAVDYNDGQYTMSVDCSYVGQRLTFTGMFIFGDCIYNSTIPPAEIVMGDNCTTTGGGNGGGSSSVVLTTVVSVVLFIVGVVAGFAAGWLARLCTGRSKQSTPAPPPAALYEEVVLPTTHRTQVQGELELKDNVAYGHVAL